MKVVIGHVKYSEQGQTLYTRIGEDPNPLVRATLQVAVRRVLGLESLPDSRSLPESMTFSTSGYQGRHNLAELSAESFTRLIEGYEPVKDIKKGGVFEVQALLGSGQRLTTPQCDYLARELAGYSMVEAVAPHSYLGRVLALTVHGMDDGPNTMLVQSIGAELCLLLDGLVL